MNTTTDATFLGHHFHVLRRMGAAAALLLLLGVGARAQSSGSLNTSFNPGTGANSRVLGIVRQGDGKLVIGGQFTTFNGVARGRVARLNYDGSIDTSFDPGSGPDSTVNAVAVGADGKVVAGGDFFSVSGVARTRLARFYVDGSLDLTFAPVVNGTIQAVAVDPAGRVYLAGSFTLVNGVSRPRVARLNIDGTLDLTFAPGTGPSSSVLGLELQSDGKVLIAGYFSSFNGVTRHRVARLNPDGTLDTTFVPGTLDNGYANFTSTGSDGKILVGGGLYVGLNSRLLRLNPNGSVDTTFNVGNNVINSDVTAAVSHANGTVIIAGYFTAVNGVSRNSVARLLANGTLDTSFNPGVGANNRVTEIVLEPDGSFVAGGDFTTYQGVSRNRITRIHSLFINQAPIFTVTNSTILEDSVLASVTVTGIAAGPVGDGLTVVPQVVTSLTATSTDPALVPDPLVTYTAGATTATLAFTPLANATGTVTITVVAQDNAGTANFGSDRSTNTFTLTIAPVNDAPSFTLATSALSAVGAVGEQSVSEFAANILAGPANEAGQSVSFLVTNNNNALFSVQPAIGANGTLIFTPALMANGAATVTVIAQDSGGTANGGVDTSAAQTFTITVVSGNVPPTAIYSTNNLVVLEDAAAQTVGAFATFSVGPVNENTQTVSLVSVTAANPALFSSQPALAANGTLTFTPAANANGASLVTVVLADDGGTVSGGVDRATNTFTITVTAVNDAPSFGLTPSLLSTAASYSVVAFGYGGSGTLGNGFNTNSSVPVAVFNSAGFANVAIGNYHGVAAKTDGTVWAWGSGGSGQLGHGVDETTNRPVQVNLLTGVVKVGAGGNHSLAVKADGTVWAWGYGGSGQLGNGLNVNTNQPVPVSGLTDVTAVVGGSGFSLALKSDGTVWVWGNNGSGLGNVGLTSAFLPVQISGLAGVVDIAVSPVGNHVLALKSDGTVWVWGQNDHGQLGLGDANPRSTPTQNTSLSGVASVAAGWAHSLVAKTDGTVWTFGANWESQLGQGTTTPYGTPTPTPVQVGGLTGVVRVGAAFSASYAIKTDGSLMAWGYGGQGQMGNGSFANATTPVQVTGLTNVISVHGGDYPTIALLGAPGVAGGVVALEDSGASTLAFAATSISAGPANESGQVVSFVVTNDNNALFSSQPAISTAGTLTFTPAPNAVGSATVTVYAQDDGGTDNGGVDSAGPQTFTVTVNAVNDAPVITFTASLVVVAEDSGATNLVGFATVTTGPANESSQAITNFTVTSDNPTLFSVAPALTGGALSFTPAAGANGSAVVTVVAQDDGGTDNGGANQTTRTFTITVSDFNNPPVITFASNVVVQQDSSAASLSGFATITTGPANESSQSITNLSVSSDNAALFSAQPALSGGTLTFTPALNAVGTATVTVIAQDNGGTANGGVDKATNTFTIAVIGVNHAPTFALRPVNTQSSLLSNGSFEAGSFTGWTATDTANSTPTLAVRANGANLGFFNVVSSDGAYSATHGFSGANAGSISIAQDVTLPPGGGATLSFTYRAAWQTFGAAGNRVFRFAVQPAGGGADLLSQTILSVAPNNFAFQTDNTPVTVDLSAYSGQAVRVLFVTDIAAGDAGNGSFQLDNVQLAATTPNFIAHENSGASSTLNFATNILAGPPGEAAQTVAFLVANNNNGLFGSQPAIAADGTLTFTPAPDVNGTATVTVYAQDNGGTDNGGVDTSVAHTFTITLLPVNSAPRITVNTAALVVNEDRGTYSGAIATITTGPADESGQSITNVVTGNNNNALFSVQPAVSAGGVLTFTPTANANGSAVVTFTAQDNGGTANGGVNQTTRTFTLTVTNVNDAPSFALPAGPLGPPGVVWTARDINRNWMYLASSSDGTKLAAVVGGGQIYTSSDSGASWTARDINRNWAEITMSADGTKLAATVTGGQIYTSSDSGATWTARDSNRGWRDITSSADGTRLAALDNGTGPIYTSSNSGETWTPQNSGNRTWTGITMTPDGTILVATHEGGMLYRSSDSGVTWTALSNAGSRNWRRVCTSADGTKLAATTYGDYVYASSDSGATWAPLTSLGTGVRYDIACSSDGTKLVTGTMGGRIYTSTDSGATWTAQDVNRSWLGMAMATDGTKLAATVEGGQIYTSIGVAGPYVLDVLEDSGAYTGGANLATSISPGPADEAMQLVDFLVSNNNNALFSVQPAVDASGTLVFTPAANALGTATVTVRAHDNGGTLNGGVDTSAAQTFTINVTNVNDAPGITLGSSTVAVLEDSGSYSGGLATFSKGPANESGQSITNVTVTANNNAALFSVQPAVSTSGVLTFTPAANANGSATVTIIAQDNGGTANGGVDTSASQTFTIVVTNVNDAPSFALPPGPPVAAGAVWTAQASGSQQWSRVVASADGTKLAAIYWGGLIHTSADSGATWIPQVDSGSRNWIGLASSADGTKLAAAVNGGGIYTSADSGATWTLQAAAGTRGWGNLGMSPDGSRLMASGYFIPAYGSTDGGVTWTQVQPSRQWGPITIATDGLKVSMVETGGPIWTSLNFGTNWFTGTGTAGNLNPLAASADGTKLVTASAQFGTIYTSTNSGTNWTSRDSVRTWFALASSADGSFLVAAVQNGLIYTSSDSGVTWTPQPGSGSRNWSSLAMSADGSKMFATDGSGFIYASGAGFGPYVLTVAEDSGAYTGGANLATSISPGPSDEAMQSVDFLVSNNNNALFSVQPVVDASGTLVFTPAANAFGTATVTVRAHDNGGTANGGVDTSAAQTFVIQVSNVNDAPTVAFSTNNVVALEDSGANTASGFATVTSYGTGETGQTLVGHVVAADNTALFSVQPAINNSGVLTFTPVANSNGVATVTVVSQDSGGTDNGGVDKTTNTFTITVVSVNDAPSFALPAGGGVAGTVTTLAGTAEVVGSDDGTGPAAQFRNLYGVAVDAAGNVYVPDIQNHILRKITPAGVVTTLAGTPGASGTNDGAGSVARFSSPSGAAVDSAGNIYVTDQASALIRKVSPAGEVTTLAGSNTYGSADGTGTAASFYGPIGIVVDSTGDNLYVADTYNHTIRKITSAGEVTTLAGLAGSTGTTDDTGSAARFTSPFSLALDAAGDLYVGSFGSAPLRKVTSAGVVTTVVTTPALAGGATGVAVDSAGNIFVAVNNAHVIQQISPAGVVTTLAGLAGTSGSADGVGTVARFQFPYALTVDGAGNLYVADTFNNTIRKVVTGTVSASATVAVLEDSGAYTGGANFATSIAAGPADESAQVVSFVVTNDNNALFSSQPAIAANGTLTFTPAANAFGSATVTVIAQDDGGTADGGVDTSTAQTFTITVAAVNDAPSFSLAGTNLAAFTADGAVTRANWLGNLSAGSANESAQVVSLTVTNSDNAQFTVPPAIAADGTLTFTPAPGASGVVTVGVIAQDNGGTANGGVDTSAVHYFTITFATAKVFVSDAPTAGGAEVVALPVSLAGVGTESGVGFTLTYDPALLSFNSATAPAGLSVIASAVSAGNGQVGIVVSQPAGGVFAAGTNLLVTVSFTTAALSTNATVAIDFSSAVAVKEVVAADASTVAQVQYVGGTVNITGGTHPGGTKEGDVSQRPTGNGSVTVADAIQIGRFAAGLDTVTNFGVNSEFQRADCAPLGSLGDGRITVADWVQALRFAGGLETPSDAGGPTLVSAGLAQTSVKLPAGSRAVRVVGGNLVAGRANPVSVQLDAQGNEAGVSLSLAFDPTVLGYVSATVGGGARGGSLVVNSSKAGSGRLGLVLVLPAGSALAAGTQELITLTFNVGGSGSTAITVNGDAPVAREVADVNANPVGASFVGGTFNILLPAGLQAAGMERAADGSPRLVIRNADGTAVTAAQAGKYEVQVTSNLGGVWTVLPNALVVEHGALKIVDPAAGGAGLRLYKLVEKP